MISAHYLTKYYGPRCAVNGMSFEIAEGEIVGLLGLNGAGKTTTLKILACQLLPSAGNVTINGIDVTANPHAVRKLVGFLPESPPLYNEMTAEAFLLFAAQLRGLSRDRANDRLDHVLELTDLKSVRHQVIGTLSHGYRQRVGIAQAIIHAPALLILDEPIKGLDPVQIVEIREMIRGLKGQHTIILSSHILPEISQTVDRILMIKAGEIIAQGTEEELTANFIQGVHLHVVARGEAAKLHELLSAIEGVTRCVEAGPPASGPRTSPQEGVTHLQVHAEDDVRARIAAAIVKGGFDLLQLSPAEQELEQAFVSLTGDHAPSSSTAQETASATTRLKGDETPGTLLNDTKPAAPDETTPKTRPTAKTDASDSAPEARKESDREATS